MAPHDDPKRLRRASEELERGLSRRDLDRALTAFRQYPTELRAPVMPRLNPIFADDVRRAHASAGWVRLHQLAVHADAAPELLTHDRSDEEAAALAWPLVWAAGIQKDFARAGRLAPYVTRWLDGRAPALAAAVGRWIEHRGAPPAEGLPRAAADPRLGHDPVRAKGVSVARPAAAPTTAEEAPRAAIAQYATLPWASFASMMSGWLSRLKNDAGEALRREVLGLCLYEAAQRLAARSSDALAPLSLALRCLDELRAPATADDARTLLHLVMDGVRRDAPSAKTLLPQALDVAAGVEALRPLAVDLARGLDDKVLGEKAHLELLGALWARTRDAGLWLRALSRWEKAHTLDCEHEPAAWFFDALPAVLADARLHQRFFTGDASSWALLLDWLVGWCTDAQFDALVTALWDRADEPLRRALTRATAKRLMDDYDAVDAPAGALDFMDFLPGIAPPRPPRSSAKRAAQLKARVEDHFPRMLTRHEYFLLTAVSVQRTQAEVDAVVARFFRDGGKLEMATTAVLMCSNDGPGTPTYLLPAALLASLHHDVASLARAFSWLQAKSLRHNTLRRFANALLDASEAHPDALAALTADEAIAIERARVLTRRKLKAPKAPAKPRAPRKPKALGAPAGTASDAKPARKPRTPKPAIEVIRKAEPTPRKKRSPADGT